jgi:hypothetical protein
MSFKVDEDTYFDIEYSVTIKIKQGEDEPIVVLNKDCSVCINEEDGWYFVMVYDVGGFTYQVFKTRDEKIAKRARYLIADAIAAIKLREAIQIVQENDFISKMTTAEVMEKIADQLDKLPEGQDTVDICNDYEDRSACYGEEFYD